MVDREDTEPIRTKPAADTAKPGQLWDLGKRENPTCVESNTGATGASLAKDLADMENSTCTPSSISSMRPRRAIPKAEDAKPQRPKECIGTEKPGWAGSGAGEKDPAHATPEINKAGPGLL